MNHRDITFSKRFKYKRVHNKWHNSYKVQDKDEERIEWKNTCRDFLV